jgi:N-acetylmuramoyl-L-alanine amidase
MSRQTATLKLFVLFLLAGLPLGSSATTISSARVWPAQDYTRLTLESRKQVGFNMFTLANPDRLVIDLTNVDPHGALDGLPAKIGSDDPYIKALRVGRFKPGVVRLVLDLKTAVKPQLFSLSPVANYGYRLVLDVYPAVAADPLMMLALDSEKKLAASAASAPQAAPAAETMLAGAAPASHVAATEPGPAVAPAEPAKPADPAPPPADRAPRDHGRRMIIVAIDAGHGGEDPGAHGRHGTLEKNVTLAIARRLKALVDDTGTMRAVLIRDGDYFIPLGGRVEKGRKAHADLFVSIHADSYTRSNASGSSVFALSEHGATSAAARWLAKTENDADLIGGVNIATKDTNLARTLVDLMQTATISDSLKLGRQVLTSLGSVNPLHHRRVEQAGFAVLKAPDIPSILVETAFISNPREEVKLKDQAYQDKLAHAILGGIRGYFAQNPPLARQKVAEE